MTKRIRNVPKKKKTAGSTAVSIAEQGQSKPAVTVKPMVLWSKCPITAPILPPASEIERMTDDQFTEWVRDIRRPLHIRARERDPIHTLKSDIVSILSRYEDDEEKEAGVSSAIKRSGINFPFPH